MFSLSLGYNRDAGVPDPATLEMVSAIKAAGGLVVAAAGNSECSEGGEAGWRGSGAGGWRSRS